MDPLITPWVSGGEAFEVTTEWDGVETGEAFEARHAAAVAAAQDRHPPD